MGDHRARRGGTIAKAPSKRKWIAVGIAAASTVERDELSPTATVWSRPASATGGESPRRIASWALRFPWDRDVDYIRSREHVAHIVK